MGANAGIDGSVAFSILREARDSVTFSTALAATESIACRIHLCASTPQICKSMFCSDAHLLSSFSTLLMRARSSSNVYSLSITCGGAAGNALMLAHSISFLLFSA